jgi:hypothetical protein
MEGVSNMPIFTAYQKLADVIIPFCLNEDLRYVIDDLIDNKVLFSPVINYAQKERTEIGPCRYYF